jgi:PIN domain nuclease of toxin-antitoxin system
LEKALILDTNIVIALINRTTSSLPARLRDVVDDPRRHYVSVVSLWEIAIKFEKGKLYLAMPIHEIAPLLERLNIELLPMTLEHAVAVATPLPETKDPFDRLLLAVCAVEGRRLVTTDQRLEGHRLVY